MLLKTTKEQGCLLFQQLLPPLFVKGSKQAIENQIKIIGNFLGEDKKQKMQKLIDKLDDEIKL